MGTERYPDLSAHLQTSKTGSVPGWNHLAIFGRPDDSQKIRHGHYPAPLHWSALIERTPRSKFRHHASSIQLLRQPNCLPEFKSNH